VKKWEIRSLRTSTKNRTGTGQERGDENCLLHDKNLEQLGKNNEQPGTQHAIERK
jgi:hypothetical protein